MLSTIYFYKSKQDLRLNVPSFRNCICSNRLFFSKNNIFEFLSKQVFLKKENESLQVIFYLSIFVKKNKI